MERAWVKPKEVSDETYNGIPALRIEFVTPETHQGPTINGRADEAETNALSSGKPDEQSRCRCRKPSVPW